MSVMQGAPLRKSVEGCVVRPATESDLEPANRVCKRVHGHNGAGELRDGSAQGVYFGDACAESNLDLQAIIAAADGFQAPGILIPTRNFDLFRWCVESGLRVVHPMTLMTIGLYNEPAGAYLPSVLY